MLHVTMKEKDEVYITDSKLNVVARVTIEEAGKRPKVGFESNAYSDEPYRVWRKKAFDRIKREMAEGTYNPSTAPTPISGGK